VQTATAVHIQQQRDELVAQLASGAPGRGAVLEIRHTISKEKKGENNKKIVEILSKKQMMCAKERLSRSPHAHRTCQ